ncbi:MAG: hypothetical protein ABI321_17165 [Polyangia bacterium]
MRSLALVLLLSGCGPASYLSITREASRTLAEATAKGAARAAPYELTSGLMYLTESRELAGYARWQEALACGRRASQLGHAALARATR